MNIAKSQRLTAQEYLRIENAALTKSEFFDGQMRERPYCGETHCLIATNIAAELTNAFHSLPNNAYGSGLRVGVEATECFTYPDVSATGDTKRFLEDPGESDTLLNPVLLVEVLSESTEMLDRGEKFANYQQIPSLMEYVLVSQNEPRVESYRRQSDGETWLLTTAMGLESTLTLTSINCDLALAEVYDKVTLPSTPRTENFQE